MWILKKGVFRLPIDERLLILFTAREFNDLKSLGIENLVRLNQIHSGKVFYAQDTRTFTGDGLLTDYRGLYLSVKVADCLPIYFFSNPPQADIRAVGICHAGWRGTVKRIAEKTVRKMREILKVEEIKYAFGPCIGVCHYEIGKEVIERAYKEFGFPQRFLIKRDNKTYFDLKEANREVLKNLKVEEVASLDYCTYCEKHLFYSARRGDEGKRNLAIIGIR